MKKILLICFTAMLLFGCGQKEETNTNNTVNNNEQTEESYVKSHTLTTKQVVDGINNKESFAVYFYFNDCPWCKELSSVLDEFLTENVDYQLLTYSVNTRPDDVKENDIRYTKEDGTYNDDNFKTIYDLCSQLIEPDKEGTKIFYVPAIMFVRNGEIINLRVGTVDGHDAKTSQMTDDQRSELLRSIAEMYSIYDLQSA